MTMLVLSRKENESLLIAGRIRVTVIRVRGRQVRLGIEATEKISVLRSELVRSKASAMVLGPSDIGSSVRNERTASKP